MALLRRTIAWALLVTVAASTQMAWAAGKSTSSSGAIERGRYLVRIGGCNDCHTSGYAMTAGKVAEEQWLTGDRLGWRGPWGTTYPANLRNFMAQMTEKQWLSFASTIETKPPMPWYDVRAMSSEDLRAIYRYVKASGPRGEAAPAYLPPEQEPQGPFILFPQPPK
ncbi:cytochrome C [Geomonas ferrireducens]|uniref:cytochrome C n=1 Tax=Geomonas ferrireducens TaxID=2570227 RepID=UPI0010A8239B|nr:cytochrome C [Geomonas ferrireducens]